MCLISHWQCHHDPGDGNPACFSLSRTSVPGCSSPGHSDTPQSHCSPSCFSLLGFKPRVAWDGQCTDEVTPCSPKPLLPNWFATVGWFCPSWVSVVSVFHCFGLFDSFLLQAHFWEKQQVQGGSGGFGTWHLQSRRFEEKNGAGTTLLSFSPVPGFFLAPAYPTLRDSWHRGYHLLPWLFSLSPLNGCCGFYEPERLWAAVHRGRTPTWAAPTDQGQGWQ